MITMLLYECRRCRQRYRPDFTLKSVDDVLLAQVSIHKCDGLTADGHHRFGMSDLIGFNEQREDDSQEASHGD